MLLFKSLKESLLSLEATLLEDSILQASLG
jgi:hypothetical protein